MPIDIRIPHLGEGADSGTVVNVFVKEGDTVKKDQTLIELENEKAVAPIPSTHGGVVTKLLVKAGDKVTVGQAILTLSEDGAPASGVSQNGEASAPRVAEAGPPAPARPANEDYHYKSPAGLAPPASPTIRRMAADLGIDLTRVRGSEPGGRIVMADLRNYIQNLQHKGAQPAPAISSAPGAPAKTAEKIDFSKWGPVTRKAASGLRQKIGQKMSEAWTTIPHVTQFDEADITALMALRKKAAVSFEKKGAHLTLTPFVMKAVAAALKKYPVFNSSLDEASQEIVYKEYVHLGVAVDTEAGLIVPVVRDADKKSMLDISLELEKLAEKTRQRKIAADELKGGSFTLSNLGSIGGTHFTPIVNKPEVAILGIGRGVLKPVVVKDKASPSFEARMMLPLALSYDHRVIDGADGARFIRLIVEALENFNEKDIS